MKIRIHEIEMGSNDLSASVSFFKILGLTPVIEQDGLTVFQSGMKGMDLNVSQHVQPGITRISLITDDLKTVMLHLKEHNMVFEGPFESHLGMLCIHLQSPDGITIFIHTPTDSSPSWLQV